MSRWEVILIGAIAGVILGLILATIWPDPTGIQEWWKNR